MSVVPYDYVPSDDFWKFLLFLTNNNHNDSESVTQLSVTILLAAATAGRRLFRCFAALERKTIMPEVVFALASRSGST